jgi:hypothetical protein
MRPDRIGQLQCDSGIDDAAARRSITVQDLPFLQSGFQVLLRNSNQRTPSEDRKNPLLRIISRTLYLPASFGPQIHGDVTYPFSANLRKTYSVRLESTGVSLGANGCLAIHRAFPKNPRKDSRSR